MRDITRKHLCFHDDFSSEKEITIEVYSTCGDSGTFFSKIQKRDVTKFTQEEIDYNKIEFKTQTNPVIYHQKTCQFKVTPCDLAGNCQRDVMTIDVIVNPLNKMAPVIQLTAQTSNCNLEKCEMIWFDKKWMNITDGDSEPEQLDIIVSRPPMYGLVIPDSVFTYAEILKPKEFAAYVPNFDPKSADRPESDIFQITVDDGRNDVKAYVEIKFNHTERPPPKSISNFQMTVFETKSTPISSDHLPSTEDDIEYRVVLLKCHI